MCILLWVYMTVQNREQKLKLTWHQFEDMIGAMIHGIQYNFYPDFRGIERPAGVYGLPRGGLVIATVLSNRLNIPMLQAPCEGCIVVDDLADSGVTLKHYSDCGYKIFTWGFKEKSIVIPDWCYQQFAEEDWIVFPWEENNG